MEVALSCAGASQASGSLFSFSVTDAPLESVLSRCKKKKKKYLKGSELKAVGIEEKQVYCAIENVVFSCPHSSSSHVNCVLPVVRLGVAAQLVSSPVSFTYVWTASNLEWSIRKILIYY